ncbi:MAG TPA: HAMP domain-containing sensor histidine kinase, partial [Aggregatilineales bacterium]|nr:HAMP domain-containing sensor histidine kinase [Aggregatilineales bacterium]
LETVLSPWADLVEQYRDIENMHTEIEIGQGAGQRFFDLRISPLMNSRGDLSGRVVMVHDMTAYKKTQIELQERTQQLEAANEQLKVLSRIKDEFVSNVSHELQTPITSLKLNQELLRRRPENAELYLGRIQRETQRLERLIEDLLHLSRLDQGRMAAKLDPTDLNTLCQVYTNDRIALAEEKGIQLVYEGTADLPKVNIDAGLIGQALSILLTNALNYTPGGGKVVVSTQSRQVDGQQWVAFCVRDTGPGIAPNEQEQLFMRFYRGTAGQKSGVPGTGLGLAIAREIVQRHQGRLEVESTGIAGEGAAFSIWLPVNSQSERVNL